MEMIDTSSQTIRLAIQERSQVGEARRLAAVMAHANGFSSNEESHYSLLATEAANNLVKHTSGGELIIHCLEADGTRSLEILSLDKGPGMVDVERCMEDGYSTAGSPGTGLGAMARLSTSFEISSGPRKGTVILMRLQANSPQKPPQRDFQVGGLSVPMPGEEFCGDAWVSAEKDGRLTLVVSDGLGHGHFAEAASKEAVLAFRDNPHLAPERLIHTIHNALRKTRGAAVAVAQIDPREQTLRFAGIGNIAATIFNSTTTTRSLISYNGIVGHQMRKVQEMSYPWPDDGLLVMHSDGIQTRWTLDQFPEVKQQHPSLVAGTIYLEYKRPRDDVTVVAARTAT